MAATASVAVLISAVTTHRMVSWAPRLGAVDVATDRSSHTGMVPRSGGVGPLAAMVFVGVVGAWQFTVSPSAIAMICSIAMIALVGFTDDLRGLSALPRLSLQCIFGLSIGAAVVASYEMPLLLVLFASCAWSVFAINAVNFMDGINGITATTALLGVVGVVALELTEGLPTWAVFASLGFGAGVLGFLPFNMPAARIFLGDVGSYLVGAVFSVAGLLAMGSHATAMVFVAVFGLYTFDVLYTLQSRLRRRVNVFKPHREHLYQRIAAAGWSHARVDGLIVLLILPSIGVGILVNQFDVATPVAWSVFAAIELITMSIYALTVRMVAPRG